MIELKPGPAAMARGEGKENTPPARIREVIAPRAQASGLQLMVGRARRRDI